VRVIHETLRDRACYSTRNTRDVVITDDVMMIMTMTMMMMMTMMTMMMMMMMAMVMITMTMMSIINARVGVVDEFSLH